MANDIYTKLTTLYLAELDRLETEVVRSENLCMTSDYNACIVVDLATKKARLDYYKKFMGELLQYVKGLSQ